MPYAPHIVTQNIAPQLLAQGGDAKAAGIASFGSSMGKAITGYFAEEEKRAKEAAAAAALMNNPFVKDRIYKDQSFWELGQRIEEGKAKRNDVSAFLAAATIAKQEGEDAQKQQMQAAQLAQAQANEKLAIAQTARMEGQRQAEQAAEERRKREEAAWAAANMPKLTEYLNRGLLNSPASGMPVMAEPWSADQLGERYMQRGGMPTPEINQFLQLRGSMETKRSANEVALAKLAAKNDQDKALLELRQAKLDADKAKQEAIPKTVTIGGKTYQTAAIPSNVVLSDVETGAPLYTPQMDRFGNKIASDVPNPYLTGGAPGSGSGVPGAAAAPAAAPAELPILRPEQIKAAKPGPFVGTNGQRYTKLPNGQVIRN